jgi:hypothetical protein
MAKRRVSRRRSDFNKSQAVRDYLNAKPEAKPKEIQEAIKEQHGVEISTQMISTIKTKMRGGMGKRRGRGRKAGGPLSAAQLLEIKKLTDQIGGVDRAREAIDMLAKLR